MSKFLKLSSGHNMPTIGLGTWLSKPGEVSDAVLWAIQAGYRHIDCAYGYGNETEVGAGIKQALESGIVKREDLFITSKLWNTRHLPVDVRPSLKESLDMIGVNYLDLYLIHWPHAFKPGPDMFPKDDKGNLLYADIHYMDTWKALEDCVDEGLVRSIGLSNFNSQQIQEVLDKGRIKPAVLQVEVNPYFQQDKIVDFCQQRNVVVTAFSCLGSPNRPWADKSEATLMEDPVIVEIANKLKRSPAQVILRWLLQRNIIAIPKSVTQSRIIDNFKVYDFELTTDDMQRIKSVNKNLRCLAPTVERDGKIVYRDGEAPYFPFHIEF